MRLAAGAKLDGYEIVGILGAGGMGEVYRARDPILKRDVAIKVLPSFAATDGESLWRFQQEAQAAAALSHPNILAVYQVGTFEGAPYLVTEFLEGCTLRELSRPGMLPARKFIDISVQIAHGLAAAHEKGIVHRDLKPENLFVTKDGRVKILDFGLAKLMDTQPEPNFDTPTLTQATVPGRLMGTPAYMAPEQVRGTPADHRTDIFAFGAVLYELLTGKRAFHKPTPSETMTAVLHEDPLPIAQLTTGRPPGLIRLVHRCLEKNPEQRFQSASDLAFALEALSETGNSSAASFYEPPEQRRRGRLPAWTFVAAALVVCVAVYASVALRRNRPFTQYTLQRVIDSKQVKSIAISPDGIYLAAVVKDFGGADTLLLHHVPTNSERTIVQDPRYKYDRVTFSPDGSYIYFSIASLEDPGSSHITEYRVPVLGGTPSRIISGLAYPLTFIERGQKLCFYRPDPAAGTYAFVSANLDGSEQQVLARATKPFPQLTVCSPSGRFAILENAVGNIESLDFSSGKTRIVASSATIGWPLNDMHWNPEGTALYTTSWEKSDVAPVGLLSLRDGRLRQITNDLGVYSGVSLTADGKVLATTQKSLNARFAELPLTPSANLVEHQTGELVWFAWLDNETIVANGSGSLRFVNLPKDQTTPLTVPKGYVLGEPSGCGADTVVLAGASRRSEVAIYSMRLDGSGLTQLTKGPQDFTPECTPDGKWIFYLDNSDLDSPVLMRQSRKSGASEKVAQGRPWYDLSPDGRLLASASVGAGTQIEIASTDTLQTIRRLPLIKSNEFVPFAFSGDSKSVFYEAANGADAKIWRQGFDASSPVLVANLPGKTVNAMRPSPDGTKLGLVLESPASEAVLLRSAP